MQSGFAPLKYESRAGKFQIAISPSRGGGPCLPTHSPRHFPQPPLLLCSEVSCQLPFPIRVTRLVFYRKEMSSSNVTIKYGDMTNLKDYISRGKKSFFASFYNYLLKTYYEPGTVLNTKDIRAGSGGNGHVPPPVKPFLICKRETINKKYNSTAESGM